MHCDIYKFRKHPEMYVYIARPDCGQNSFGDKARSDKARGDKARGKNDWGQEVNANKDDMNAKDSDKANNINTDTVNEGLAILPTPLRQSLGAGELLMHLDLADIKQLARVDKQDVIAKLEEQGYFVQSPPADVLTARAQARMREAQDKKYD